MTTHDDSKCSFIPNEETEKEFRESIQKTKHIQEVLQAQVNCDQEMLAQLFRQNDLLFRQNDLLFSHVASLEKEILFLKKELGF